MHLCRWMRGDALQDVDEIVVRVDLVQAAGDDEALQDTDVLSAEFCPTEQPCLASHRHHMLILPISGRKLKFIIVGTRFTGAVCGRSTASNGLAAALSMSRSHRAS